MADSSKYQESGFSFFEAAKIFIFIGAFLLPFLAQAQWWSGSPWKITRPAWDNQDESKFGEFVAILGRAVARRECFTVAECLKSPANLYYGTDPAGLALYADCADLPYFLRAYFAWKNELPMSVESDVAPREFGDNPDVRYTKYGNYVTGRYDIIVGRWSSPDAIEVLNSKIINLTFSASYRMMGVEEGGFISDFYPVKLGREGIRPGTVIYDPNGHVAIVYKVTDDGHIFYLDAHPDNTLTTGMYSPKFLRSHPFQGAGFKNFRPLYLSGATQNYWGEWVGGKVAGVKNSQLADYSLEQFYGNLPDPGGDWTKGKFIFRGVAYPYYEYLRLVMASGELKIDPLKDMQSNVTDICVSLKDRVIAVDFGIRAGIDKKDHPFRLPKNIYGTDGEWEAFATPARDGRLKVMFMDLLSQAKQLIHRWRSNDPALVYIGANLPLDLLGTYRAAAQSCRFEYKNSQGQRVPLDLDMVRLRLFDLSFDPYHCVELRWGALSNQELASCQDSVTKRNWYSQERWLRYQWERRYDVRMDYSLEELQGPMPGVGIAQPPDIDIVTYLNSQK